VTYEVIAEPHAERALRKLARSNPEIIGRIGKAIDALAQDPRPPGALAMAGTFKGCHRVRVGTYRVIYQIDDARLLVLVIDVDHRRESY
jgi:mRNA interferase RelE/StbE